MASIAKRGKVWQLRFSYVDKNGKRRYITQSYTRKKLAENAADELAVKYSRGAIMEKQETSLIDYWDKWFGLYKSGRYATVTEKRYETTRKRLLDYFGPNRKLKDITKSDYQEFMNQYIEGKDIGRHRSKETVEKLNSYVRSMVSDAIDDQVIYSDFTKKVVLQGVTTGKAEELKYLEVPETKRLLEYTLKNADLGVMYNCIIATGILTGARFSEIIGLTWDDVDFDKKTISINKTWDYVYKTGFKKTKTPSSVREIDIPAELIQMLHELKIQQAKYFIKVGYRDPKKLVFMNKRRQLPGNSAINKALDSIETKLNIEPAITFHGLRHTHASYLISKGIDIYYISKRLGHANVEITMHVYAHLLSDKQHAQIDATLKALSSL